MEHRTNPLQVIMVGLLLVASFLIGSLWTKVKTLEGGSTVAKEATPTVAAGAAAAGQVAGEQVNKPSLDQVKALFADGNIAFGDASRKVLFVEFSDPSCPWCQVAGGKNADLAKQALGARFEEYVPAVPEMKKLVDQGKASFVWFYRNGHGNGELAAQLLYCAQDQGQFWEVSDLLMSSKGYDLLNNVVKNDVTKLPELMALISGVKNADQIQRCTEEGKYKDRLAQDVATGTALGAGGTPHFIVNANVYEGAASFTDMKSVVDQALQ